MSAVTARRGIALAAIVAAGLVASAAPGAGPSLAAGVRLYDNTGNPANTYYSAQGGAEAIDDVHLVAAGVIDSLVFEYFEPAPGASFSAIAHLYANPGGLDLGTAPLAGPFQVSGLGSGRRAVAIPLPGITAPADLWVGVRFTSASAGLVIHSVPAIGGSHDFYLENGGFYWFDGEPRANFGIRLVGRGPASAEDDVRALGGPGFRPPYPNPFRVETTIRFVIDRAGRVRLDVYDLSGRRIRSLIDDDLGSGVHHARWWGDEDAGGRAPAGRYVFRLSTDRGAFTRSVVLTP